MGPPNVESRCSTSQSGHSAQLGPVTCDLAHGPRLGPHPFTIVMEHDEASLNNHAAPVGAAPEPIVPSATEAHCCMPFRSHAAPRDPHESDEDESSRSEPTESVSISDLRLGDASHPSENKLSDEPNQDRSHSYHTTTFPPKSQVCERSLAILPCWMTASA